MNDMNRFYTYRWVNLVVALMLSGGAWAEDVAVNQQEKIAGHATYIDAEQISGRPERVLNVDGQVQVTKDDTVVFAQSAEYHAIEDLFMAREQVQLRKNQDCYLGKILTLELDTGQGYITSPTYKIGKMGAHGEGSRIDFINHDESILEKGTYTTCSGVKPDWYLYTSQLDLNRSQDEGVAHNTLLYFKDVPILAWPKMSFPLSGTRRSGFLPPTFNSTTTGGAELMIPFYWNIAPNRDATLFPKYISKRGLQLGGEFRYLESTYNGILQGEVTPKDQLTHRTRYSFSSVHNQNIFPGLGVSWHYSRASDDQYIIDYSHSITESSQHLLPQAFSLGYVNNLGTWGVLTSDYQVLQDANRTIIKPYAILPKVFFSSSGNDLGGKFDWAVGGEYAHFASDTAVNGERLALNGQLAYPVTGTYFFITPKAFYHLSQYHLTPSFFATTQKTLRLAVSTFSLDSGLYFERDILLGGHAMTQTLEPRLFYVRTPYYDQSRIPLFDTGAADLSFAQLFTENRFVGQDRVGDANQLTFGVVSRFIGANGLERIRFNLAQRVSLSAPRVVDVPFWTSGQLQNGQMIYTTHANLPSQSDLIVGANGKISNQLSVDAIWQYSQTERQTGRLSYGLKWQPAPMKVLNVQYRYQPMSQINPDVLKQVDVSGQWPIALRWYGVARANYSIEDRRLLDGLIGFEYKEDCWIVRSVIQRYVVPSISRAVTAGATTSFFLQLELNGLSKIGSNPLQILRRSIPGYQPVSRSMY